jgi:hypothetical protein
MMQSSVGLPAWRLFMRKFLPLLCLVPIIFMLCGCPDNTEVTLGRGPRLRTGVHVRPALKVRDKAGAASRVRTSATPDDGTLGSESQQPFFSVSDTLFGSNLGSTTYQGLERQSDCSLTEVQENIPLIDPPVTGTAVQTIPHFEQYLHTVSGLTTNVDTFASGCKDPSISGVLLDTVYLGKLSGGQTVVAEQDQNQGEFSVAEITSGAGITTTKTYEASGINGLLAADFNGDGIPDLAVVSTADNATQSTISIYLNNGDGTLGLPSEITLSGYEVGLVAGDFTGKGHVDLVATVGTVSNGSETGSLQYFTGKNNGTFSAPAVTSTGTSLTEVDLPYDINQDGKLDLVAVNQGATAELEVLLGNGDGTFSTKTSFPVADVSAIAAGDLNGDGKIDLVLTSSFANTLTIAEGAGDGTFTQKGTLPTLYLAGAPYITDMDGDGNADIMVGYASAGFFAPAASSSNYVFGQVLLGHGDFTFSTPSILAPAGTGSTLSQGQNSFVVADLNGDNKQDVAAAGISAGKAAAFVYLNASGVLTPSSTAAFALEGTLGGQLIAADFNGDTKIDLLTSGIDVSNDSPAVQAALNSGTGTFTAKTVLDVPAAVTGMAAGVFGSNAYQDLALVLNDSNYGPSNGLYIAAGNNNGTFAAPVLVDSGLDNGVFVLASDVNMDGKMDLVAINSTGAFAASQVRVYMNQGGGKFAAPVVFTDQNTDTISSLLVADFNKDGSPDLGFVGFNANSFVTTFYVYTGNKTGSFALSTATDVSGQGATNAVAADFNNDGTLDVVVDGCCGLATPQVLIGRGGDAFYPPQPMVVPVSALGVRTIQFNGGTTYPGLIFGYGEAGPGLVPVLNHYAAAPTVGKAATKVTASGIYPTMQGEYEDFTVTVAENPGEGLPTGTLNLLLDGTTYTAPVFNGAAEFDFLLPNIPAQSYSATLTYSGDLYNSPSSATVMIPVQYATAATLTVTPDAISSGATVTLKAKVTRQFGTGTPTGSVLFFYNNGNTVLASANLVNGTATLTAPTKGYPTGIYLLSALYQGDTLDGDSISNTVNVSLAPANLDATTTAISSNPASVTMGQNITLTIAVADVTHPATVVTGSVSLSANGEKVGNFALSKGKAVLPVNTGGVSAGSYAVTASYISGGKFFESAAQPFTFILKYADSVFLSANTTTVKAGGYVALNFGLQNASYYPSPTGTITLTVDGKVLATLPLSTQSYVVNTAGLAAGNYSAVASYSGDAYNGAASSPPVVITVQ